MANAKTVFVRSGSTGLLSGSQQHPFATIEQAKLHMIRANQQSRKIDTVQLYPGVYRGFSLDHPALSGVTWKGTANQSMPIVSGGLPIPRELFEPWDKTPGAYVADISSLNATDLGQMVSSYNCVDDCQHDKVGYAHTNTCSTVRSSC